MNPTLVAKAYFVITFLSISYGFGVVSFTDILLFAIDFVGVEGTD